MVLSWLPGVSVLSAADNQSAAENLPPLIVSAARTDSFAVQHAASITVITSDQIQASGARSLAELLRGRPGVFVSDLYGDGSNATIDMRGFGQAANSNTLVMIDGRKLNPASDIGALSLNSVNLANVKQVEIIQGSAGILYGNMGVGGVINIITRDPEASLMRIGANAGSYGAVGFSGRLEQQLDNGWSLLASLDRRESDNYRNNNDSDVSLVELQLDKSFSAGSWYVGFDYLDDEIQTPGALFLDEVDENRRQSADVYANDFQKLERYVYLAGADWQVADDWLLSVDASLTDDTRNVFGSFRSGFGFSLRQSRETIDVNPRLVGKVNGHHYTLGIDYQQTDYLLTTFGLLPDQEVDQDILAFYGQGVFAIANDWQLVAGLRHARYESDITDVVDLDDDVTIGMLGINYQPAPGWRLFARADQNYRFAKVDEQTNLLGPPGNLENQEGVNYELGAEFSGRQLSAGMQVYQLELDDEISFDSSFGFPVNINLDETRRQGISGNLQFVINENWLAGGNVDYVDAEVTDGVYDGEQVPLVPETRARVFVEYRPSSDWTLLIDAIAVDEQVYGGDYANQFEELDSFTVMNLAGSYTRPGWSVSWRLNNLWDEEYAETGSIGNNAIDRIGCQPGAFGGFDCPAEFPSPERNLQVSLSVDL